MKIKNIKSILLLFSLCDIYSCNKLVDLDPPVGQLISSEVFNNEPTASAAIAGIYRNLRARFEVQNSIAILSGLSSDELYNFFTDASLDQFTNNNLQENNSNLLPLWSALYNGIYQTNAAMEGLSISTIAASSKSQFLGEAKFLRAFCYFYLVNYFGDVPLLLTTNVNKNAIADRSNKGEVYVQIVQDLKEAESLLSPTYTFSSNQKIRANRYAATALLARVYLYMENWSQAENEASAVINSGLYTLTGDLNNTFLSNNSEAILQWGHNSTDINSEPSAFIFSAQPNTLCTNSLVAAFENGDQRKSQWIKSGTYLGNTYYYPYKYKIVTGTANEFSVILRLGEQYLITAEAKARQNKIPAAISDINIIRQRAGLPTISLGISQDSCLKVIMKERRTELFAECSHRWFDLKRSGEVGNVLEILKPNNWQGTDALYPIPLADLQSNPNLKQNPGY